MLVSDYKYLSVHLKNRLDLRTNSEAVYKKRMSRLYFLRKYRHCTKLMETFYQSAVASTIFFAFSIGV